MTSPYEEGDPNSKLICLAEAPSVVELRMGKPLCGPSGEVFNDCLHASGLIRRHCYILNVWPFRIAKVKKGNTEYFYPFNSRAAPEDLLWRTGKGFTQLGLQEAQSTVERIKASSGNLILAMGQQAMDLATGKPMRIMKWRGSILEGVLGKKVIPTPHPAATIHGTYLWRYLIIADMEKAKVEKEYPELRLPERNLIVFPSFDECIGYIRLCRSKSRVNTDLEVINHEVHCFSLAFKHDEAVTVPLCDEKQQPWWTEEQEERLWLEYAALMGDPAVAKVNQNIVGFDSPFLFQRNNIFVQGELCDPMIAQHIMYPEFNKGLDFITSIHTREPYYKDEGKMWKGLGMDFEVFHRYCGKDSCVSLESWDVLAAEMTEGNYWPTYHMTARMANPLTYMGARGFKIDLERLEVTKKRVKAQIEEKRTELKSIAEWDFSPSSPKQCAKYFYETKGITPYKNKDGGVTTDDKALSRIYRRFNLKEAKIVQEIRTLEKLDGTYLEMNFDKDGYLRCSWNPRGTWTGRLSSGKTVFDTGGNMQNLHPEFREFLVPG